MTDSFSLTLRTGVAHFSERQRDFIFIEYGSRNSKSALRSAEGAIVSTEEDSERLAAQLGSLLHTEAQASVSLPSGVVQKLKDSIKKIDATHIRFFNEGEKLRVVVFDYVKFHASYRLPRKKSNLIRYHETLIVSHENFSATFLAQSFLRLPTQSLQFRFGGNGVTQISTDRGDTTYLIRDQRLKEPMTVFFSKQVNQSIALVFHPK